MRRRGVLFLALAGCANGGSESGQDAGRAGTDASLDPPVPMGFVAPSCTADVVLSWSEVQGASYVVEWGRQGTGASTTTFDVPAGTTRATLPTLGPGQYFWHVMATSQSLTSPWSTRALFTVAPGNPGAFGQSQPSDFLGNNNLTVAIVATGVTLGGELDVGSGIEGVLAPSTSTTITGGVHQLLSLKIPSGVTLTVTGTQPLLLKVKTTVDIEGTLDASGAGGGNGVTGSTFGQGGIGSAGGSNGGDGIYGSASAGSDGAGQGKGGKGTTSQGGSGAGFAFAGYASPATSFGSGTAGGAIYGTADLLALLGGSGGGGGSGASSCGSGGGGAGGGVVQIAAGNSITIGASGALIANGGNGGSDGAGGCGGGGGGSGGAVWLASPSVSNDGTIRAAGGKAGGSKIGTTGGAGSAGRVRIDGVASGSGIITPPTGFSAAVAFDPSGNTVTPVIAPTGLCGWGTLTYEAFALGTGAAFTIDVLDAQGNVLAPSLSSGTDLSSLGGFDAAKAIKLRANLFTTDVTVTPLLRDWSVGYSTK